MGFMSGKFNDEGNDNVFIGQYSGFNNESGNNNVAIGNQAGKTITGEYNTIVGSQAGSYYTGSKNVLIGSFANLAEDSDNKLVISSKPSDFPLITGDFEQETLTLNSSVSIRDFLQLKPRVSAPIDPEEGTVYYEGTTKTLKLYVGNDIWKTIVLSD